jgi:hypothetical protein
MTTASGPWSKLSTGKLVTTSAASWSATKLNGDVIASRLMRYRDGSTEDWADIIDMLTLHPEERRRVARLLANSDREAFLDARESKVVGGEGQLREARRVAHGLRRPLRARLQCQG